MPRRSRSDASAGILYPANSERSARREAISGTKSPDARHERLEGQVAILEDGRQVLRELNG